jgi:hypothetical protein
MAGVILAAGLMGAAAITKGIMGISQTAKANRALENFKRQDLRNVTEGMRVSTLGAQLNTREAQRRFATSVDALRSGGVRGVVGGLGAQEQLMQNQQASISAELDRQQVMIEQMRAQDEARIRGMQEQRESFDQQMLYGQKAAGRQATMSAVGDLASAGAFFGMNYDFGGGSAASKLPAPQLSNPNFFGGGSTYGYGMYGQNPPNEFNQYVRAGQMMGQQGYFNLLPE